MIPFLLILAASLCWGQASPTPPALPHSVPPSARPTPTGSTVFVHSSDNLQSIYNAAACGSDLVLDDGATFTGNFVFNKQCTAPNWILVEGIGCANGTAAIPNFVTTATANLGPALPFAPPDLTNYATLTSSIGVPVISISNGTPGKYNYFGCLQVDATAFEFQLINTSNNNAETLASQLADHIIFDRIYPHGYASEATNQVRRAWFLAGSNISIVNSYAANIYDSGSDSQAIGLGGGPGPYLFQNNFLSASTEIIMPGGGGPVIGYSCTVAASPAPTTTTATVNTCIDSSSGSVSTPAVGTQVMFHTSASAPLYSPLDFATITGNTTGALTFAAITAPPLAGAGNAEWGLTPDDATISKNFFWKDPCWNTSAPCYDGITRSSKDFWEMKEGHRWNANGNIFVNTFNQGQQYAFNFNSADPGSCPWCVSSDITLQNFIVKNAPGDLTIISTQGGGGSCPGLMNRVLIQNGIFFPPGSGANNPSGGRMFSLTRDNGGCTYPQQQASDSIQINHVTMPGGGTLGLVSDDCVTLSGCNFSNLKFANNLWEMDQFRLYLVSGGCTDPCYSLSTSSGTITVASNATINSGAINGGQGVSDSTLRTKYGSGILSTLYDSTQGMSYFGVPFTSYSTTNVDYHGFALAGSGSWRNAATDGTDPGVNFTTLDAALGGPTPGPCSISPAILGPWTNTQVISQTMTTTCGGGTITWTSSGLPSGLSGCSGVTGTTCVLSGTLNTVASYFPTITATASNTASISPAITVNAVPSISTMVLPNATAGMTYSQALNINGGTSPFTCSISSGTLSGSGLTLGSSTCAVTGTPTSTVATYSFTARVTDTNGISATQPLTVSVTGSPCDLNGDGIVNVQDTQLVVNMSLSIIPCTANINGANVCNTVTIQRVVTASLGGACTVGP